MPYTYGYEAAETGGAVAAVILLIVLGFYLLMLGFCILTYILQSLGMYTIAKRRQIRNPWLAWLPVGNMWILGSISDQYQYVAKGRVRNRRKVLLGTMIAVFALMFLFYGLYFVTWFSAMMDSEAAAVSGLLMIFFAIPMMIVAIVAAVFQYIALHDLFASCEPNNAVVFLVLSILINVTLPFFVFACRKKDLGMPPKKTEIPPQLPETNE